MPLAAIVIWSGRVVRLAMKAVLGVTSEQSCLKLLLRDHLIFVKSLFLTLISFFISNRNKS